MDFLSRLFDTSDFPARWHCGVWTAAHGWLHILSDIGIWGAYLTIPCVLAYFLWRRRDLPFRRVLLLFMAFIFACGTTHLMEAVIFWWPAYRLAGLVKLATAIVSWATVVALIPVIPRVLAMRSPEELEQEIRARRDAEDALQRMNADLERRVEERTAELRQAGQRFRTLADSISQLAWMARADGHIEWYNQRWYDYTGMTPAEMEGWGWQSVHDPQELPRVLTRWKAAIARGIPWEDTFPLRRHDGEFRWHLSRAMPLRDEQGRVTGWFGTNTDITEIREMQQTLHEADRRKNEFLATLAHELRNPLAPLRSGVQLLGLETDAGGRAEVLGIMERQLGQMVRLIDDLLDVSRISRNRLELRRSQILLKSVLENAVETARPLIDERRQQLHVQIPDEPLELDGDLTRLAQVFWNLLHNSAKYTDPGGRIDLIAERQGNEVVVTVRDTGVGIPPEALPGLFAMFSQVAPTLERSQGGLGIGLALVKGIVEMHGGMVSARSQGLGHGSEFIVRLPLLVRQVTVENEMPSASAPVESSRSRERVLVIDDNRDAALTMARLLAVLGHETRTAYDGYEGLKLAQTFQPNVVLLDIGMPGMNGYEVCRKLRELPGGNQLSIIAVTGWGQEHDRQQSEAAGFDHHLVKPVEVQALTAIFNSTKGNGRSTQAPAREA